MSARVERRLAAIMAADVSGYTRLMGNDEVGTLNALKAHRRERIDPRIARHAGRIVKATGDGFLAEFFSVVDAVVCAVAIQRAMLAFNADIQPERRIVFRIGINVGDIIIDEADIFGDGVNVAARLETLCEPGGIFISRSAHEQVCSKVRLAFADLGEQKLKNVAQPVGIYGLHPTYVASLPDEQSPDPGQRRRQLSGSKPILAGAAISLAIASFGAWWIVHGITARPVNALAVQRPAPFSADEDPRQSVIVLPFENSSGDPAQDELATRMTRELTDRIALGRVPVVPAITAAPYRRTSVDLQTLAHQYRVRFAITGDAQKQNAHLIVSASVFTTADGRVAWSQQIERPDTPDALSYIVQVIYQSFWQASVDIEAYRALHDHPDNLDQRDLAFALLSSKYSTPTKANFQARIALADRLLALDPDNMLGLEQQARLRVALVVDGFSAQPSGDREIAEAAADRLLQLSPNAPLTLLARAAVLHLQRAWDE